MLLACKVFLATAYPQRELVGIMKRLLAYLSIAAALNVSAQEYNPDADGDGLVTITDMLSLLTSFGQPVSLDLEVCQYLLETTTPDTFTVLELPLCRYIELYVPTGVDAANSNWVRYALPSGVYQGQQVTIYSQVEPGPNPLTTNGDARAIVLCNEDVSNDDYGYMTTIRKHRSVTLQWLGTEWRTQRPYSYSFYD